MSPTSRFHSPRGGSNLWAQSDHNIDAWVRGAQLEVRPLTMEYAPILACDADCPLCPFKKSRDEQCRGLIRESVFAAEDNVASSNCETARKILECAREAGIRGVLFTGGGEPLKWEPLPEMLEYSRSLGMANGLYTNGFQLGRVSGLASRLMSPSMGLVFVRVSVNTASPRATRIHWGLGVEEIENQRVGLSRLVEARDGAMSQYHALGQRVPSIQISTIVDKNTVGDLPIICETIAGIMGKGVTRGDEDVVVVRPLTIHGRKEYSEKDHQDSVIDRIVGVCGEAGAGRRLLESAGLGVFLGFGLGAIESRETGSYSDLIHLEYSRRRVSLANGLFLTVSPDGSVFPSTEYNCKKGWELGNLTKEAVNSIWCSSRRREVLDYFNSHNWGPAVSQATARTNRLDKIADAIKNGELGTHEITRIREASYTSAPLLLD